MILLSIDSTVTLLEVEDTCSDEVFLPDARFTLSIKIPDRFRKYFDHIGPLSLENIVDMMPRDDIRFTAFERLVEAEKAYDVDRIGVETLPRDRFQLLFRNCHFADKCWSWVDVAHLAFVR